MRFKYLMTRALAVTGVALLAGAAAVAVAEDKADGGKAGGKAKAGEGKRWTGDGISWAVPEGWTQKEGQGPRFATLVAGEGDGRVEITVTVFPGDVGGVLANVNRWRMQVGLAPVGEEDLEKQTTKVEVAGQEALLVDLSSDDGSRRLLAAMIPRGERSWFVKILGPAEAVGAQGEAFETFVKSIEFPEGAV